MIHVSLTDEEAVALNGLLDAGVKVLGLQAAAAAAMINQKLIMAAQVAKAEAVRALTPLAAKLPEPPAPKSNGANSHDANPYPTP